MSKINEIDEKLVEKLKRQILYEEKENLILKTYKKSEMIEKIKKIVEEVVNANQINRN
ncbi:MAG: hypothetical protein SOR81_08345 [Fusobacterium sp.]|uniref:hypothetical protein n=1 Tax=Fusobacterium sp. TaxID=68766 RepID=UPI002A757FD4|nr:hypothetical protein [Fusobacterium sp.]MDY2981595.1 hypothetical protein [Fusobacterium sp.]